MDSLERLSPDTPSSPSIHHAGDATFEQEVLNADLPVVVDFWADWCAPCRFLGGALEEIAPSFAGRLKVVKVDVDRSPALAERYGIRSIPTLVFFDGGKDAAEASGAMGALALHDLFEQFLSERAAARD